MKLFENGGSRMSGRIRNVLQAMIVAAVSFLPSIAMAQEEGGGGNAPGFIDNAGPVGLIIIALSIAGLSLIITFALQIRRDVLVPPELLGHVEELFEAEDYDGALEVCETNPSFLSSVLAAGLPKIDRPYHEVEVAMEDSGDIETSKLHQKVGYLSLIAAVAPMLGLLGTVLGMVKAFDVIANSETSPQPSELAVGISSALTTTMLGLIVAIPMSIAYYIFKNRVNAVVLEVSSLADELMERFDTGPTA